MLCLRKSSLAFIFFILSLSAIAGTYPITRIHGRHEVLAEVDSVEGFQKDAMVVITSEKNKVIAIGRIRGIEPEAQPMFIKVRIVEVLENNIIMLGDRVSLFNKEFLENNDVPGFNSLTLGGGNKVSSQYKDLAYFGVFTSDGHTLDEKEFLVSPFQAQYGITDTLGFKVVNALWFDGYVNAGLKKRVVHNKHAKITVNGLSAYKIDRNDWIIQGGGVITLPSNSKFQSHLMANFIFDEQSKEAKATKDFKLFQTSDIRSITEYITDNWNRVLYGPVYNVELQTFGGTVSYMWIWKSFHMSLGIATRDFTELNFGSDAGYYYVYDFFFRF